MAQELVINIIGWLGAAAVLYAYVLVSTGRLSGDSKHYQFFNILGAACLVINTWFNGAYPSVVVNIIWILVAVFSLTRPYFARTRVKRSVIPVRERKVKPIRRRA